MWLTVTVSSLYWIAWSASFGLVQASADMQSMRLPDQGGTAADYTQGSAQEMRQAVMGTAGLSDNMTAQVVTLELLAHNLQQHLAGGKFVSC